MTLPIFSDRSYVPAGMPHTVMLFPFWGKNPEDPDDPNTGRFDRYTAAGHRLFRLSPLTEAEVAVFPLDWSSIAGEPELVESALEFAERAHEAGTPALVFFVSDSDEPIPLEDAAVLRTSLYRSRRRPREFAQPAWSEDLLDRHLGGELRLRRRGKPVVGFCGLAPQARSRLLRLRGRATGASDIRASALQALRKTRGVGTNFVVRSRFLGGAIVDGRVDASAMQRVRREYVENMVSSDYILCARGAGNFSYRLYETLSCGRIPVFVDTDCVLPFDFELDWREYCVWVDERDVDRVGERVAEFHERLSEQDFLELQRECRRLWEERVAPEGFFAHLDRHLGRG